MGAGRKTETIHASEEISHRSATVNSNAPAWNLKKKDLGGVIFGCTKYTMNECLTNMVFGLPAFHFAYIQNIEPGLPLFLFNYSDRTLHGIYEATSHGQMNIDPHGWTENASGRTQYPSQVRVCIRKQCKSLTENQYSDVLHKDYINQDQKAHFRFELDHGQTRKLISMFGRSPVTSSIATVSNNAPMGRPLAAVKDAEISTVEGAVPNLDKREEDEDMKLLKEACCQHLNQESVFPFELPCSRLSWASLFKANSESGSSGVASGWDEEKQLLETHSDKTTIEDEEEIVYSKVQQFACNRENGNANLEQHNVDVDPCGMDKTLVIAQLRKEVEELKASTMEQFRKTTALEKKLDTIEREQAMLKQQTTPEPSADVIDEWEVTGLDGIRDW